jgi:radical SAM superfamily enzyme YgiQ (UPF0313 family)
MYTSKAFRTKKEEDVFSEIETMAGHFPEVRKVFLADGNPFVLSFRRLSAIVFKLNESFPRLRRISTYALPGDILAKTDEELAMLKNMGFNLLYVGIESGDDEILKLINKSETTKSTIQGLDKAKKAGIKLSVIILQGVGGKLYSEQHARESAKILNIIQPEYASSLVLSFPYGEEHYSKKFMGKYQPMKVPDLLKEMELFISHCELNETIFRSNHASNYLELNGILNRDKEAFLKRIRYALEYPEKANLREEWQRGL